MVTALHVELDKVAMATATVDKVAMATITVDKVAMATITVDKVAMATATVDRFKAGESMDTTTARGTVTTNHVAAVRENASTTARKHVQVAKLLAIVKTRLLVINARMHAPNVHTRLALPITTLQMRLPVTNAQTIALYSLTVSSVVIYSKLTLVCASRKIKLKTERYELNIS